MRGSARNFVEEESFGGRDLSTGGGVRYTEGALRSSFALDPSDTTVATSVEAVLKVFAVPATETLSNSSGFNEAVGPSSTEGNEVSGSRLTAIKTEP